MKKIIFILFVIIFFISTNEIIKADTTDITVRWYIPFNPPSGIEIHSENEIKEFWPDSVLFSIELFPGFPITGKDFSSGEYYMVGEEIIGYSFHIKKFDSSIYLSNITLTFVGPNDDIYYNDTLTINITENDMIFFNELKNESFIFDNKGIWKFSISFESNKMNLVWRETTIGTGLYQTFQPAAYHNGIAHIFFYNFYNEGLPVLSGPEVLQISQNAYIAQQTAYLREL